ncbi:hypothetical protein FRC17_000111 [Serendipita sp. 399]|nr:hypothetical protein FRC17_000111 [Serendipita sp. 399]
MPAPSALNGLSTTTIAVGALVTATITIVYTWRSHSHSIASGAKSLNELPGPRPKPIIGNARDFPTRARYQAFSKYREQYGDIVHLRLPTFHLVLLSKLDDADELLNKRAHIWSARPYNRMVDDYCGFAWGLITTQPTASFYEQRKVFRKVMGPHVVSDFDLLIEEEAKNLIKNARGFSGDPHDIIHDATGAVVIRIAYGDKVHAQYGPELVELNLSTMAFITWSMTQLWIINLLPISRFIPTWFPGLQWPAVAKRGSELTSKLRHWVYDMIKEEYERGTADPSVISKYIGDSSISKESLRDGTALMYLGGVDTTGTALMSLFANLLIHPHVQKRLHQELDAALTPGHFPTFADLESMQYLKATWNEVPRVSPPVPGALPHVNSTDDVWNGYFFPKGTILIANIGDLLRDPRKWGEDAHEFKPERFLPEYNPRAGEMPSVESIVFGFGRRICPGRHFAHRNGMMFAAAMLSTYEILPPAGEAPPDKIEYTPTQVRYG